MSREIKDNIYEYCKQQGRPLTAKQIVEALYPGKSQPYVNSHINSLVDEDKLERDDSVSPYQVRFKESSFLQRIANAIKG